MAETSTQEKAKKLCYERRATCIMKKAMELQILCGLKIGVVILSPDGKLESWPPQLNDVKALLHACKERGPRVKSDNRKEDCREILVSKLQLLNQREELFKGKEIATTSQGGETLVRSKKRKDFGEQGCLEILNSKLQLLKKREMLFSNGSGKEIVSMEGIESQLLCDGVVLAYGQEEGDVLTQNLYDDLGGECDEFFFNNGGNAGDFLNSKLDLLKKREMLFLNHSGKEIVSMEGIESQSLCDGVVLAYGQEEGDVLTQNLYDDLGGECDEFFFNNGGNAATFKGKEIATMDSGILQHTAQIPNQWHYGSSRVNSTLQAGSDRFEACYPPQNSFTALGNGLPSTVTASEECGELQVRKKARLQYPIAALNNNLPQFTPEEYWETVFTDVVNSTDVMLSLLEDL